MAITGGCDCELEGGAKRKLVKKTAAKRKPSPYNLFVKKHFPLMQKQHPAMKAPQIMKLIAKEWKSSK